MNRKYKILIADDEYWVRRKLAALLDWEALGIQCLEPAKDGMETLERVRSEKPDILVTDINRPFLNGVELLQKVHQEQPEMVSFVVSGYDDFEYVKGSFLCRDPSPVVEERCALRAHLHHFREPFFRTGHPGNAGEFLSGRRRSPTMPPGRWRSTGRTTALPSAAVWPTGTLATG